MGRKLIQFVVLALLLSIAGSASADLVAWWNFNEGSGTVVRDRSGNGHDGTIEGAPQWTSPGWNDTGWCMQFGGADDRVTVEPFDVTGSGITLAAWINVTAFQDDARVISKAQGSGTGDHYWAMILSGNGENNLEFRLRTDTGATTRASAPDAQDLVAGEWIHVAVAWDASDPSMRFYRNGQQIFSQSKTGNAIGMGADVRMAIGNQSASVPDPAGRTRPFGGRMDDVVVYDHGLDAEELAALMSGLQAIPYARSPVPADGSTLTATWTTLSWAPGAYAVSHDVYVGERFEDVNAAAAETFRGNQAAPSLFIGLGLPGDPYPGGLVPGTTYYWRIDEVNNADPNSPWRGQVWSFTVPPRKAYEPRPADVARYVVTDGLTLSWTPGMDAKVHTVYFGDSFDDVNAATGGSTQAGTTYSPGPLASDKAYYWRVDEFDGAATHRGDVWSFTTVPTLPVIDASLVGWWKLDEGQGATAVDWSGHGHHGTLNGAPQWAEGFDGGALEFEFGNTNECVVIPAFDVAGGAITLSAWVRPESFSQGDARIIDKGTDVASANDAWWMLSTVASGGNIVLRFRLKTDESATTTTQIATSGAIAVGEWTHAAASWDGTSMILYENGVEVGRTAKAGTAVATNSNARVYIGNQLGGTQRRPWDGLIDDARVYNKALSVDELSQAMRGDVFVAWGPVPDRNATVELDKALPLSWSRGDKATQHDVYFGLDRNAVANADASDTTGVYRGRQSATSYNPPEGVEWGGGPYYWRIDQVNNDGTISAGRIWSFRVADYLIVDDIESYNDLPETDPGSNRIYTKWIDGFGTTTNGAFVGNLDVPLTERGNVHGGSQAMPLSYDNNLKFSEATLTLTGVARDWTRQGVGELSLWFRGLAANAAERMYVVLSGTAVVYQTDTSLTQKTAWTEWVIPLQQFTALGADLSNVTSITIGFGTRGNTTLPGGTGQMYFDDIRLYRPRTP